LGREPLGGPDAEAGEQIAGADDQQAEERERPARPALASARAPPRERGHAQAAERRREERREQRLEPHPLPPTPHETSREKGKDSAPERQRHRLVELVDPDGHRLSL